MTDEEQRRALALNMAMQATGEVYDVEDGRLILALAKAYEVFLETGELETQDLARWQVEHDAQRGRSDEALN